MRSHPRHSPVSLVLLPLALLGLACSAGPATVDVEPLLDDGLVRLTVSTRGKNTFSVAGASCEAPKRGSCALDLPTRTLQGGWNELTVSGERRIRGPAPSARFFLGEEAFRRECEVTETRGSDWSWRLACTFDPGFAGELLGERFEADTRISAGRLPLELFAEGGEAPLQRVELPLMVTNDAGGRFLRPLTVVAPAPLTELAVDGMRSVWFERQLPLTVRTEPGARVTVDGREVAGADRPEGAPVTVAIGSEDATVVIEASRDGRLPHEQTFAVQGRHPATPLLVDLPRRSRFTTGETNLVLQGSTLPAASLYLDGRRVPIEPDGSFRFDHALSEGDNEVTLMAAYDDGGRPPTTQVFSVLLDPDPDRRAAIVMVPSPELAKPQLLAATLANPLAHLDTEIEFAMELESIDTTSRSGGGCTAVWTGEACLDEVEAQLSTALGPRPARACRGARRPVQVDMPICPSVQQADRLRVRGTVKGAIGGRRGVLTVERPRVEGTQWMPAPRKEGRRGDRRLHPGRRGR